MDLIFPRVDKREIKAAGRGGKRQRRKGDVAPPPAPAPAQAKEEEPDEDAPRPYAALLRVLPEGARKGLHADPNVASA